MWLKIVGGVLFYCASHDFKRIVWKFEFKKKKIYVF